jgi:hypothetical protein
LNGAPVWRPGDGRGREKAAFPAERYAWLLVSHQEEFAEAFADGYRFELQGGTTVATRFQR